ncbi:MAG TPA: HAD hydrolase-like protein [Spirochaetota bacterium]|jgi:beta-phosphoglucomutase-like phosphatase (HAD superfamily)|nr:HAD hydrolase-like protein [Spirochaetota bacterium]HPV40379.1 HAD hydrolase-like protein [Spirochaetota bacterium]
MNIQGMLIDFDGVISRNSVLVAQQFSYDFINSLEPIPFETFQSYFKLATCFSQEQAIALFFTSLGLDNELPRFLKEFKSLNSHKNMTIEIDNKFLSFIDYCDKNDLKYTIFSLAEPERMQKLGLRAVDAIYPLRDVSKANTSAFLRVISDLDIDPGQWIYIDDNPLALRAGKRSGLHTVMMLNDVFTISDYHMYSDYIDHTVENFPEFERYITVLRTRGSHAT